MLSNYCRNTENDYRMKININNINKLVPNLRNKSKYVLHYNLQLYLSLGMKLTNKRQNAANSFGTDLFKLMNNSVYGKTKENLGKRIDVRC